MTIDHQEMIKQTHCKNGHEWTTQNTYWRERNGAMYRDCKICRARHGKIWQQKNRKRLKNEYERFKAKGQNF